MIIAIIPARGGSKGLPRKNLLPLLGKPLIAHTIEQAQRTREISDIFVSTEDVEIAEMACKWGAKVIIRPVELALDNTPTLPVLQHVIEQIDVSKRPSKVVTLQATSPLRTSRDISQAISLLTKDFDSCVSVCLAEHTPYKMLRLDGEQLFPFIPSSTFGMPRQNLPPVYRENGAIYVTWTDVLMNQNSIWGLKTKAYIMDSQSSLDIDNALDFKLAEVILSETKGREF